MSWVISALCLLNMLSLTSQPFSNFGTTALACAIGLSTVVIWAYLPFDFDCDITMPWCKDLLGVSYGCRIIVVETYHMLDIKAHKEEKNNP